MPASTKPSVQHMLPPNLGHALLMHSFDCNDRTLLWKSEHAFHDM